MNRLNHNQLSRIKIYNYKSIKECNLELRDINILIGSNGAGKSNFISVFTFLNSFYLEELDLYVARNGMRSFFYNGLMKDIHIGFGIGNNPIESEVCFMASDDNKIHAEIINGDFKTCNEPEVKDNSLFYVYHFHDVSRNPGIKHEQNISNCKMLLHDASNIAAFLYRLKVNHRSAFQNILGAVRLVAPYFKSFELEPNEHNSEHIVLKWRQKGCEDIFNTSQLSDGTLRFICLATLLLQPVELQPATIIIDEPELGLHPFAIVILAELVKKAAFKKQIILSTQSVELLDQFDVEDIIVVDYSDNGSEFKRLASEELEEWLEDDYTLGELWNKNILGGRP